MSTLNWFGCTPDEIVDSLYGTVYHDFSSVGTSAAGLSVIQMEMDFAEGSIFDGLDATVKSMLSGIIPHFLMVTSVDASGNRVWDAPLPISSNFFEIRVDTNSSQSLDSGLCRSSCTTSTDLTVFTDYTRVDNRVTFGASWNSLYKYYVSYTVDTSQVVLPSLAKTLRDRVCCVLGQSLFSLQEDTWKLIDRYCQMADMPLMKIPTELRRLSFFRVPWGLPLVSLNTRRIS